MPLQRCSIKGKRGWRWGKRGKCYTGPNAKLKAIKQGIAIEGPQALTANARPRPDRVDPTRTTLLQQRFIRVIRKRLDWFKKQLIDLIVKEDAFGIGSSQRRNRKRIAALTRWIAHTDSRKVEEFRKWIQEQVDSGILEATDPNSADWLKQYIQEAYEKGAGRAFDDARKQYAHLDEAVDFYRGTRHEFLSSMFRHPASQERVRQLVSRTFEELKGMTDSMRTSLSRILSDGLIQGDNPKTVARRLVQEIDGIDRRRARTIARTETIRAHAEGQLDSLERLGVEEVGVMVEWSTAGDDLVCPLCADLDGLVLKISEARMVIPRHPNCRCAWIPANVGESTKGQKRSQRELKEAIESSILKEVSKKRRDGTKRTKAERIAESRWAGADLKPSKKRPEPSVKPKKR